MIMLISLDPPVEPGFLREFGACERLRFDARVVFAGALRELPELFGRPDSGTALRARRGCRRAGDVGEVGFLDDAEIRRGPSWRSTLSSRTRVQRFSFTVLLAMQRVILRVESRNGA